MPQFDELLQASAALHDHLCPRQVLGIRMGLFAGELLGIALPQTAKRLLTIAETDGCFTDGIAVATNCWVGRRTMRVEDYGKVAATFVDTETGQSLRLAPLSDARHRARFHAPDASDRWHRYLLGYQRMPAEELFSVQRVELCMPVSQIISQPKLRAICEQCDEEVMNGREIIHMGRVLCRACAGASYYREHRTEDIHRDLSLSKTEM